ncbi:sugar kinase [Pseudomonas sp. NBRC 111137]|uniref:sugar kinase n=1 Tax=Pseudomonas sp. NBRC 111137 TaxID=1661052 RepID=UPI000A6A672D|nr:sugar kinase [Pseudomonas sp. NBRC 111137]
MGELMRTQNPRIAAIGECMIELRQNSDDTLHHGFGGDTLNTAIYMVRLLGDRAKIDYFTALGNDSFSDSMCRAWAKEGIGLTGVQRLPGRLPGLYCIQNDAAGERRFLYWRTEAAVRDCFATLQSKEILETLTQYDLLYISGITLAILGEHGRGRLLPALRRAHEGGTRIAFDNNYRPRLWCSVTEARVAYRNILPITDVALVSEEDDQALFGYSTTEQLLSAYAEFDIEEIIVKRGSNSCLLDCEGERAEIDSQRVDQVIDTTAAGDSFGAAYLASRILGRSPGLSAVNGHRLASLVIQHPGALISKELMANFAI